MKKTILKTIGGAALAILMLAIFAQVWVSAQDSNSEVQSDGKIQGNSLGRRADTQDLEGSWDVQVTIRNCQTGAVLRAFPAMNTYMRGGTLHEFGIGSGLLRGPGHGTWIFQSEEYLTNRYSSSFQFFRFNADGTYAGKQINRRQIDVNRYESGFTATSTTEIFNASGVLIATGCATETGRRFE